MTILQWLHFKRNAVTIRLRAIAKYYFFKSYSIKLGKNVILKRGAGNHSFGENNIVFDNCIFEVFRAQASITTGKNCFFSYGVIVACSSEIVLGDDVWIGEYTSIRDATHQFSMSKPMGQLPDLVSSIKIGNNVWIGRGCIILPGTVIHDNVIIGANSVIKGIFESGNIYAGSPARLLKAAPLI